MAALTDVAVQSRVVDLGYQAFPREQQTPEAFGALVKSDAQKWWLLINVFWIKGNEVAGNDIPPADPQASIGSPEPRGPQGAQLGPWAHEGEAPQAPPADQ